ncbi:MAG: hypothetical protein ACJ8BF_03080 [Gemmatimonadales bacterium]
MTWGKGRATTHPAFLSILLLASAVTVADAQLMHPNPALAQTRQGFWASGGLGYGSASCGQGGIGGGSAALAAGWTVSPRLLVAIGTNRWSRSERRLSLGLSTLDARVRFYPDLAFGFFFTGGLGLGAIHLGDTRGTSMTFTGAGILGGAGYDIALVPTVSLTPFANLYLVRASGMRYTVAQMGMGLTIH